MLENTSLEGKFKIVCHLLLTTFYEPNYRGYLPEIIDESQCTHVVLKERISYRNATVKAFLNEGKEMFHQRAADMRKKGIHVSSSIFKYNLNQHVRLLSNSDEQARFVASLIAFNEQYNFDGFDFYWSSYCRGCLEDDNSKAYKDSIDLVRQMSEAFKPRGWLLTAMVAVNTTEIDAGFDIQKLSE